jgi:Recombination endonuclease VII
MAVYGITAADYWNIYAWQGCRCYICERATGAGRKKLSVDHCHKTGAVRGLLCGPCNRDVLGHLRDDPEALLRAARYLTNPPAQLAGVFVRTPDFDLTQNGEQ